MANAKADGGLVCPKCRHSTGEVLHRPDVGGLVFTCKACGHQWVLFDRSAPQDSER